MFFKYNLFAFLVLLALQSEAMLSIVVPEEVYDFKTLAAEMKNAAKRNFEKTNRKLGINKHRKEALKIQKIAEKLNKKANIDKKSYLFCRNEFNALYNLISNADYSSNFPFFNLMGLYLDRMDQFYSEEYSSVQKSRKKQKVYPIYRNAWHIYRAKRGFCEKN